MGSRRHLPAGPSIGLGARRAEASSARWSPLSVFRRMLSRVKCTTREESSRQIRACLPLCNQRAKTSASRSIGRTSPPFAPVQPRRRLTDYDQDEDETSTKNLRRIASRIAQMSFTSWRPPDPIENARRLANAESPPIDPARLPQSPPSSVPPLFLSLPFGSVHPSLLVQEGTFVTS